MSRAYKRTSAPCPLNGRGPLFQSGAEPTRRNPASPDAQDDLRRGSTLTDGQRTRAYGTAGQARPIRERCRSVMRMNAEHVDTGSIDEAQRRRRRGRCGSTCRGSVLSGDGELRPSRGDSSGRVGSVDLALRRGGKRAAGAWSKRPWSEESVAVTGDRGDRR